MKTSLFDFVLPADRIAQQPANPRDAARLLVVTPEALGNSDILNLPALLTAGDILVFNNTKVIPARLVGKRGEAKVEITLHKMHSATEWQAFARPAKRLRENDALIFAEDFCAQVIQKGAEGEVTLRFGEDAASFMNKLQKYGHMPLPPYMKREDNETDKTSYQTVYAKHEGAVAAPTAGLHFTDRLFEKLEAAGIQKAFVTLHVGAGTFLPVKAEDTTDHKMHAEMAILDPQTAQSINEAKARGGRVIAVGTTSLRVLESAAQEDGVLLPYHAQTDIFITPGYRFKIVDMLLTNFHLPKSTLFMLVSALCGLERMKRAYTYAIENNYRFYSYGDACLLSRAG